MLAMVISSQARVNLPVLCYSHSWHGSVILKTLVLLIGYSKNGHDFAGEIFRLIFCRKIATF